MRTFVIFASLALASSALAAPDAKTQRQWKAKCAACHGEDGKGQTEAGKKLGVQDMTTAAWQKEHSDAQIKDAMQKGVKASADGKRGEMPAVPDLQPAVADALVQLVRGLAK